MTYLPGVMFSVMIAMAATFVSNVYGGPTVLFALLLGMAFNFLSDRVSLGCWCRVFGALGTPFGSGSAWRADYC